MVSTQGAVHVAVVGAGTAGCIVAGHLASADRAEPRAVRLFEEGPDEIHPLSRRLADQPRILESEALRRMPERRADGGGATLLSGRLVGGGWSVNHGVMMMPTDGDLRSLAEVGGPGWSVDHLRALAARITTDLDRAVGPEGVHDAQRGSGPVPLARPLVDPSAVSPATAALLQACEEMGVPWVDDVNHAPSSVGVSSYAYSSDRGDRVSSATAVLGPARGRSNLTVTPDTQVRRLVIRGSRVVALEIADARPGSGRTELVDVDHVVLSAGVFHTPQILLRSGIGPGDHLRACGIEQVMELPGVGAGFRDHAKYEFELVLTPREEDRPVDGSEPWAADPFGDRNKVHLRLRSSLATEDPDLDLQLRHDPAKGTVILTTRILEQRVSGTVRLDPDDITGLPVVDSGMLRDRDDVRVMLEGIRFGIELLHHPLLAGRYRLQADAPRSDEEWAEAVLRGYGSYNHGIGTCRMGSDAAAVVDQDLRVHGIENLSIVDGSILPVLPHVTTNYPVAIIGQWAAEHLLQAG
jgi:choline dehydrogenase